MIDLESGSTDLGSTERLTKKKTKKKKEVQDDIPLAEFSGRSQIDEVLQKAYLESTLRDGRKTKKDKDLLESIKRGEGLRKDDDGATLLANTYDPDEDPKNRNKKAGRATKPTRLDADNPAFVDYENEDASPKAKKRTKKSQPKDIDSGDEEILELKPLKISDLAPPISHQAPPPSRPTSTPAVLSTAESDGPSKTSDGKKKKKKKQKPATDERTEEILANNRPMLADRDEVDEGRASSVASFQQPAAKPRKKKKGKNKTTNERAEAAEAEPRGRQVADKGRVLLVVVHRTDKLKSDFIVAHPVVQVHVVDKETGQYLKKQNKNRSVSSRFETNNDNVDFILPIMTLPFDFKKNCSTLPIWEDQIIFNENYDYFVQDDPKVILLFELMDFMSMGATNRQQQHRGSSSQDGGWHQIAWAFLEIHGDREEPNIGRRMRLQLYEPPPPFRRANKSAQLDIYQWYRSTSGGSRTRYPSTLYITVKSAEPQPNVPPSLRSMWALQEERSTMMDVTGGGYLDTLGGGERRFGAGLGEGAQRVPWSRVKGQQCKVPNYSMCSLPGARRGCFVLKFSNNGRYLACGCRGRHGYPILIYEIPSGVLMSELFGHYSIIYDLSWSFNDQLILSASSDGTAKVWTADKNPNRLAKMLPHPSFVYCGSFHPGVDKVVVTGGYDKLIRVWSIQTDEIHAVLLQELEGHGGYVNTLCFNSEGTMLYSGDSLGHIFVWSVYVTDKPSSKGLLKDWTLGKEIIHADIEGSVINSLSLHPNDRRLIVHTRNNKIKMLDLRVETIMCKYIGALNLREQIRSVVTPCGAFVISGSEDGLVYVWNTESGDQVAVYTDLGYSSAVCDVTFHPHDHIIAFCSYDDNQPIKIYKYDHQMPGSQQDFTETLAKKSDVQPPVGDNMQTLGTMNTASDMLFTQTGRLDRVMRTLHTVNQENDNRALMAAYASDLSTGNTMMTMRTGYLPGQVYNELNAPSFVPITGKSSGGLGSGNLRSARSPNITLSTAGGSARVSYHGGLTKDGTPAELVKVLYDYQAQRSDELNLGHGEVIKVVFKDNNNWWMAERADGQQGFIPANYVAPYSELAHQRQQQQQKQQEREEIRGATPDQSPRREATTHAVVTRGGELKFLSGTEDSDLEDTMSRSSARRRRARSRATAESGGSRESSVAGRGSIPRPGRPDSRGSSVA